MKWRDIYRKHRGFYHNDDTGDHFCHSDRHWSSAKQCFMQKSINGATFENGGLVFNRFPNSTNQVSFIWVMALLWVNVKDFLISFVDRKYG